MNPIMQSALTGFTSLLVPEMILLAAGCLFILGSTFRSGKAFWGNLAIVSLILAGLAWMMTAIPAKASPWTWIHDLWSQLGNLGSESLPRSEGPAQIYYSAFAVDRLALFVKAVALVGGFLLILTGWDEVSEGSAAEHYACLLFIVAGLSLTGSANELIGMFLALELISIPTYVLLYLGRSDRQGQEATVKYFLLSIMSSGFLLFAFSYLYGITGTTNLSAILQSVQKSSADAGLASVALIALVFLTLALGFRITAVPFHFYAPDVYQGTSSANAALLAFIPKVAGFTALIRLLGFINAGNLDKGIVLGERTPMLFYILAVVTMTMGNWLALLQDNLKRLLAYSSVAHAGYMLMGLVLAPMLYQESFQGGIDALLFYLVAYGLMTIGAFAVLAALDRADRPVQTIEDLAGLSRTHPMLAFMMAICLLSLIGMPMTAGFVGKALLFIGAVIPSPAGYPYMYRVLALVGAINAAVGGWYYLRVIAVMYLRQPVKPLEPVRSAPAFAVVVLCSVFTVILGCYPKPLSNVTRDIASPLVLPRLHAER